MKAIALAAASDLRDVLAAVGESAAASHWRLTGVEWQSLAATVVAAADRRDWVDGEELLALAGAVYRTDGGHFDAYRSREDEKPWLSIRVVGGVFSVRSEDRELLERLRKKYGGVDEN